MEETTEIDMPNGTVSNYSEYEEGNYSHEMYENYTDHPYPLVELPVHMVVIYSVAYGLVFVLGVVGNSLVITLIYKDRSMRNVTNYFILNMAVADILVALIVVPITLLDTIFSGWRFGAFMCKITPYVQGVVQCASVNTLAAIAIDRYRAIWYSLHSKITACASRTTIVFIWVYAASLMIPSLIVHHLDSHHQYSDVPICYQLWEYFDYQRAFFIVVLFGLCYLLPLLMILVCYLLIALKVWKRNAPGVQTHGRVVIYKSKVKVLKMLAVIVALFAFSWLPLYSAHIRIYFGGGLTDSYLDQKLFDIIIPFAQWLGSSNCGMNPVIYCFFSKKYRRGFRNILSCKFRPIGFRRRSTTTHSMSTRYVHVDSGVHNANHNTEPRQQENRVSSTKFMVVAFNNGKMTVSFRKENGSDESSF